MINHYNYYFEQLATKNKLIAHTADRTAFYKVADPWDLEEFDNALNNIGKTPAMLLEKYEADTSDGNARNYWTQLGGCFNILDKAEVGRRASIDEVQGRCELIGNQLLNKMRADLGEGDGAIQPTPQDAPVKAMFKLKAKMSFIGPLASDYYGVSVRFSIEVKFNAQVDPNDWLA